LAIRTVSRNYKNVSKTCLTDAIGEITQPLTGKAADYDRLIELIGLLIIDSDTEEIDRAESILKAQGIQDWGV